MRPTRQLLIVATALVCAACRVVPAGLQPPATPSALAELTSASPDAMEAEAPPECGFPPGTALEFAGRSTTATLDVQEVVGDPMSDDPADIYITSDKFDQGDLHGRLVCAVYVDAPGFVEITVHPEDGGRFVPPTPFPSTTPPANGLSEAEALEVARAHLDEPDTWRIAVSESGPIGRVLPYVLDGGYEWAQDIPADHWVWRIFAVRGDEGVDLVIDYVDGTLLGTTLGIVN
ncbi:MAG TPA: hypothetical protein VFU44_10895 [Candidatus Limnocylindria bacterium]|nr:hypothetical protein [Candidatus Limnocylindria bacterium]